MATSKLAGTHDQALLDLINRENSSNLLLSEIIFSKPIPSASSAGLWNTLVHVTGANQEVITGTKAINYTRRAASEAIPSTAGFYNTSAVESDVRTFIEQVFIPGLYVPIEKTEYTYILTTVEFGAAESKNGLYTWKAQFIPNNHYVLYETATTLISTSRRDLDDVIFTSPMKGFTYDDIQPSAPV